MKKIIAMTSAVLFVTLSSGLRAEEHTSDCEKGYKWSEEAEKCVPEKAPSGGASKDVKKDALLEDGGKCDGDDSKCKSGYCGDDGKCATAE